MNVAIDLPEDIARQLAASWQDMPRRALEAVALEVGRAASRTRLLANRGLSEGTPSLSPLRWKRPHPGSFRNRPCAARMIVVSNTSPIDYLIPTSSKHPALLSAFVKLVIGSRDWLQTRT